MDTGGAGREAVPWLGVGRSGAVSKRARVGEKLVALGAWEGWWLPGLERMPCSREEAGPSAGAGGTGCRVTSG